MPSGGLAALVAVALPLSVTVCIETAVAALFGLRRWALGAVAAVNFITNPLLNLLWSALFALGVGYATAHGDYVGTAPWMWPVLGLLEVIVIFAEWRMLVWVLGRKTVRPRRLLTIAVVMNVVSATLGTFLLTRTV